MHFRLQESVGTQFTINVLANVLYEIKPKLSKLLTEVNISYFLFIRLQHEAFISATDYEEELTFR